MIPAAAGIMAALRRPDEMLIERQAGCVLMACGLPVILTDAAVAFMTDIEITWPLAGCLPLLPLAVEPIVRRVDASATERDRLLGTWRTAVMGGVIVAGIIVTAPVVRLLPVIGVHRSINRALSRVTDHRSRALEIDGVRSSLAAGLGQTPLILTDRYQRLSLLAFYLPDAPVRTSNAHHRLGGRRTPYDFFPDTDLNDPALEGEAFLLLGATVDRWNKAFLFGSTEVIDAEQRRFIGLEYRGVRQHHGNHDDATH